MSSDLACSQNVHESVEKRTTRRATTSSIAGIGALVTWRGARGGGLDGIEVCRRSLVDASRYPPELVRYLRSRGGPHKVLFGSNHR
jgi:hypothetical protein